MEILSQFMVVAKVRVMATGGQTLSKRSNWRSFKKSSKPSAFSGISNYRGSLAIAADSIDVPLGIA